MNIVTLSVHDFKPSTMDILWPSKTYRFVEDERYTRANIKYPPLMYFLFWYLYIFKTVQTFIFRQLSIYNGTVFRMKVDHYFMISVRHYWGGVIGWLRYRNMLPKKDWIIWIILLMAYIYVVSTWEGKYVEPMVAEDNITMEVDHVAELNSTSVIAPVVKELNSTSVIAPVVKELNKTSAVVNTTVIKPVPPVVVKTPKSKTPKHVVVDDKDCKTCFVTISPKDSKELVDKVSKGYTHTRIEDIFNALRK